MAKKLRYCTPAGKTLAGGAYSADPPPNSAKKSTHTNKDRILPSRRTGAFRQPSRGAPQHYPIGCQNYNDFNLDQLDTAKKSAMYIIDTKKCE